MDKLKCQKCGNEWYPRTPEKPKMCPACKCRKWEKNSKEEIEEVF